MTSRLLIGVTEWTPRPLPRLADHAALLQRGPQEWQVGIDPARALVFSGPGFTALLSGLAAHRHPTAVHSASRAAGLSQDELDDAVVALDRAGLLVESAFEPTEHRVRLLGAGPVGLALAGQLLVAGIGELAVFDERPPELDRYPTAEGAGTRSAALRDWAQTAYPDRVTVASTPVPLDPTGPYAGTTVTVVVADGPEVDRSWVSELVRHDQPHLIVRTTGDAATVGPFVVPGTTSCLRCHDLLRRDRDPSWPTVLAQLTRLDLPVSAPVVAWAAAYACTQVLAWLAGGRIDSAATTVELSARDFSLDRRRWPTHPECGCRWNAPTEWGP